MLSPLRKRTIKSIQAQIRKIHIVQQLKKNKSSIIYKKFILSLTSLTYQKSQILRTCITQPIKMIFITQGSIMFSKIQQTQNYTLHAPSHLVLDKQIQFVTALQDYTTISQVPEKQMYQAFQGLIQFPQLSQKLKLLKKISQFSQYSKKKLIKICMEIIQLNLLIGATVYKQNDIAQDMYIVLYGQLVLFKNNKKISYISQNQIFGNPKKIKMMKKVQQQKIKQLPLQQEALQTHASFFKAQKTETYHNQQQQVQIFFYQQSAKIVSQKAIIYKLKRQLIQNHTNETQLLQQTNTSFRRALRFFKKPTKEIQNSNSQSKKLKWRQIRFNNQINFQKKQLQLKNKKQKINLVQKYKAFNSFYKSQQRLSPRTLKFHTINLTNSKDKKYNSEQQYYQLALKNLQKLRTQKYGQDFQDKKAIILFPMKIDKKIMRRYRTQLNPQLHEKHFSSSSKKINNIELNKTFNLMKIKKSNFAKNKSML